MLEQPLRCNLRNRGNRDQHEQRGREPPKTDGYCGSVHGRPSRGRSVARPVRIRWSRKPRARATLLGELPERKIMPAPRNPVRVARWRKFNLSPMEVSRAKTASSLSIADDGGFPRVAESSGDQVDLDRRAATPDIHRGFDRTRPAPSDARSALCC